MPSEGRRSHRPVAAAEGVTVPSVGIREVLFVLVVCALIFGARRLPDIARGLGAGIRNFKGSLTAPAGEGDSGDGDERSG